MKILLRHFNDPSVMVRRVAPRLLFAFAISIIAIGLGGYFTVPNTEAAPTCTSTTPITVGDTLAGSIDAASECMVASGQGSRSDQELASDFPKVIFPLRFTNTSFQVCPPKGNVNDSVKSWLPAEVTGCILPYWTCVPRSTRKSSGSICTA